MTGEWLSLREPPGQGRRHSRRREAAVGVTIFFGGRRRRKDVLTLDPPKKMVGPRRP